MVRNKWPCIGTTSLGIQNWRFDLGKAMVIHVLTNCLDNRRPLVETLKAFWVGNQIQVTLAIDGFWILNPFPFVWQWPQSLGQKGNLTRTNRQFTGIGLDDVTFDPHEVAKIGPLKDMVLFIANQEKRKINQINL